MLQRRNFVLTDSLVAQGRRGGEAEQRMRGRGVQRVRSPRIEDALDSCFNTQLTCSFVLQQVAINVSTFLSDDRHVRKEVAASLKKLSQSYDVFFIALCTTVEIRVSFHSPAHALT